jgi:hypothetical protein
MKELLSLFTFGIGALCFVVFVTVFKRDAAVSAVPGPSKPDYCNTEASLRTLTACVFAAVSGAVDGGHTSPKGQLQ